MGVMKCHNLQHAVKPPLSTSMVVIELSWMQPSENVRFAVRGLRRSRSASENRIGFMIVRLQV